MRKMLALLLTLSMFAAIAPASYAFDDEVIASVFFTSDYQFYKQHTPGLFGDESITTCQPVVEKLAETAKKRGHDVETMVVGGDYTQNDSNRDDEDPHDVEIFGDELQWHYGNTPEYSIQEIKEAFGKTYDNVNYVFLQGNHDPDVSHPTAKDIAKTGAHEFDDYIVYVLNDEDFVGPRPRTTDTASAENIVPGTMAQITNAEEKVKKVANEMKAYLEGLAASGDSRPVFICSHQPLHYTTNNYNGNAHYIFEVVNAMSYKLDIIYFYAHTHSLSDDIGGGLSYVAAGQPMDICNDKLGENGRESRTLNFTYLNYGYLGYYNGINNVLSCSVADIKKDSIKVTRYGVFDTLPYHVFNVKRKNIADDTTKIENKVNASLMFAADYQYVNDRTPDMYGDENLASSQPVVNDLAKAIKDGGHDVERVIIGGDYTANDGVRDIKDPVQVEIYGDKLQYHYGNTPVYSIDEIESTVSEYFSEAEYIHVQGNHDPDLDHETGKVFARTGAYEYEDYIIYVLNDEDFVGPSPRTKDTESMENVVPGTIKQITDADAKVKLVAGNLSAYLEKLAASGEERPVFICSHQPLHFTSNNYNGKAHYIYDAVQKASGKLDILFWFGHTHDQTDEIGGGLAYVPVGGKIALCDDTLGELGKVDTEIGFTYLSYGNLGYYNGVNEVLAASAVDITDEEIIITKYGVNGNIYTIETIKRDAAKLSGEFILTIDSNLADVFGREIKSDVAPMIRNDRTFTPARFVAENLGATVEWNAESQLVTITKDDTVIKMTIGVNTINVNGVDETVDVAPFIENDRTFTPARIVAEKLGAKVDWNANERKVIITAE